VSVVPVEESRGWPVSRKRRPRWTWTKGSCTSIAIWRGQIVFRTGLEFVAVEKDAGDFLSAYVDGLREEERANG
jgi:hypothetical protein